MLSEERQHGARELRRQHSAFRIPHSTLVVCFLAGLAVASGCSYRFGACSLYPGDVRTINVPMFESNSFRRNLGERLTEAVVREIEATTPYKVVNSSVADSTLTGRIVSETKGTVLNAPTSEARNLQLNYQIEVAWTDRRGNQLQARSIPLPANIATIDEMTNLIPEGGQSMATSQQKVIDDLAKQIVSLMEAPW